MVRQVKVSYNAEAIISLFDPTWSPQDTYEYNLEYVDHLTVSNYLCPNGTQWKYDQGLPKSFCKGHTSVIAMFWLFFVAARLLPTNFNNVMKEHAYMVYTILTRGPFDVGDHICHEIVKVALGRHDGSLGGM